MWPAVPMTARREEAVGVLPGFTWKKLAEARPAANRRASRQGRAKIPGPHANHFPEACSSETCDRQEARARQASCERLRPAALARGHPPGHHPGVPALA